MSLEHVANSLCLEFTNSINDRHQPSVDWLTDARTAREWALSLGVSIDGPVTVVRLRQLRDVVYSVFHAVITSEPAPGSHLAALESAARADTGTTLEWHDGKYRRALPATVTAAQLRARIAASAVELLLSDRLHRVRECPSCGWLFLDTSKNGTRRWCSMAMCGGRVKARRHYERVAAGPSVIAG